MAVSLTVRFPRATINEARRLAESWGTPLSYVIRRAAKEWVAAQSVAPQDPPLADPQSATTTAPAEKALSE